MDARNSRRLTVLVPFVAVSAIVPSLLLIWYFHSRDVNPEPIRMIWGTFALGVLTVIPVLLVDRPIVALLGQPANPYLHGFGEAFLVAGFPEEFFKFLVLLLFCLPNKEFDEPMDGIVYGAIASLGFATFENILYVADGGIGAAITRALTAVPGHAFMGAIMGYYAGQAKFQPARRTRLLAQGYLTAVLLHGLYDSGLLTVHAMARGHRELPDEYALAAALLILLTIAVLAFEWTWAVRLVRRLRGEQFRLAALQHAQFAAAAPFAPAGYGSPGGYTPAAYGAHHGSFAPAQGMNAPMAPSTFGAAPGAGFGAPPEFASPPHPAHAPIAWPAPLPGTPMAYGSAPAVHRSMVGAWIMVVTGGIAATLGGLFGMGLVASSFFGSPDAATNTAGAITAIVIFGLAPLAGGIALFAAGLNRLTPTRAPQPTPALMYR